MGGLRSLDQAHCHQSRRCWRQSADVHPAKDGWCLSTRPFVAAFPQLHGAACASPAAHLAGRSFRSTISRAVPPRARPPCIPDGLSRLATTGPIGMYKAHPWHPMPIDSAVHSALVLIPPAVESAILNSARPHAQQLNRYRFGRHGERPFLVPSKQRQHSSKTKRGGTARPHANCG